MSNSSVFKKGFASEVAVAGFSQIPESEVRQKSVRRQALSPRDAVLEHAERIRQEAFKKGFEEGKEAGMEAGMEEGKILLIQAHQDSLSQEVGRFVEDLDFAYERVSEAMDRWYLEAESRVAEIICEATQRLIQMELATNPDAVLGIVREAISQTGQSRKARIRINPFDLPKITEHRDELLASSKGLRSIEIIDDPSVTGGCIIESDGGVIDASLETIHYLMEGRVA